MTTQTLRLPPDLEGPLDRAVRALFDVSWGKARAWIAGGKVCVGGVVVIEPTTRVSRGADIGFDVRGRKPRAAGLSDGDVVHVDAHIVVVAKPAGVSTVPYDESDPDTLDARVRAWLSRGPGGARGTRPSLGIVHRLDKETTGLVVFTRTWLAKQSLSLQFRKHTVHRVYTAIAHGDVATRTIRSFLVENRGDGLRGSARGTPPADAREATTHLERLERLAGATLVGCRLETGRTHQIRIHLSESGNPIVGERVYIRHWAGKPIEAPRLMLHAAELGFVHPATEREMRWEQPLPKDMDDVAARLARR